MPLPGDFSRGADLDGNLLIGSDPFTGVTVDNDFCLQTPNYPGLGVIGTA